MTFTCLRLANRPASLPRARQWASIALLGFSLLAPAVAPAQAQPNTPPNLSRDAQQIYQSSRNKLVQIRTLLKQSSTQSSTGSGFYVAPGVLVTNFHVVADLALQPERHRGVAVATSGQEQAVQLLAFDVRHDLAVLQVTDSTRASTGVLSLRPAQAQMTEGERIFSLGNPLDVGFAITEGTYNGLVQRSFYPRIFFGGALNPGMSGGPALDAQGRVIGVNVAKRSDAEQVSFLVPVQFVRDLLARTSLPSTTTTPEQGQAIAPAAAQPQAYDIVTQQLTTHQQHLTERLLAKPKHTERFGPYRARVPNPELARCWGDGKDQQSKSLMDFEVSTCRLDTDLVVGSSAIGAVTVRYETYHSPALSKWQFAERYAIGFGGEPMRLRSDAVRTAAECQEAYVGSEAFPMRAVLCLSAYRKFSGLYDLNLLAISLNRPKQGLLMRVDVSGVTLDNAQRIARAYLHSMEEAQP